MHYISWFDRYIDIIQNFLAAQFFLSPLLLLFIEEMGVPLPVPGDAIIAFIGYRLTKIHNGLEFWLAFFVSQIAVLGGATILFYLSRRWGQMLLAKLGKFVFIKEKEIRRAEGLFAKNAVFAIIIGRHIPGLRIAITVFAATSGVRYRTFVFSTFISTSAWILFYLFLGKRLGADFRATFHRYTTLSFIVIGCVIAGIIILHLIGIYRNNRKSRSAGSAQDPGTSG